MEAGRPPQDNSFPKLRDASDRTFVFHAWRYGALTEIECDTLEEAESTASGSMETGEAWPGWITLGDQIVKAYPTDPPWSGPRAGQEDRP